MTARIANLLTMYLHCRQGVPGAPYRTECMVLVREPGPMTFGPMFDCVVSCRHRIR